MIVAVPPQTLTARQKELLNKKGYVVVETEHPEKIRIIMPEPPSNANDYLLAALHALNAGDNLVANSCFVKELYKRLIQPNPNV